MNIFLEPKCIISVHKNPARAGIVQHAEDCLYSTARDYAGMKGLVKVEKINLHLIKC